MVELLLTLLVLYGLQSVVLLPRGTTLFFRLGERWRVNEGPGWTMLHPWPSAPGWLASRSPLLPCARGWLTRGPTPLLGADFVEDTGVPIEPGSGQSVALRGRSVRVNGVTALRAATKQQASRTAGLLSALASNGSDAEALLDAWSDRAFAPDELARARARADSGTRWLGIASSFYLAAVFLGTPALAAWFGGEQVLFYGWPVYLVLHVVTWLLLFRAHGALVGESEERFEALFTAAIYPPMLVRAAPELRRQALCGFHPSAVAAEVLPREAALDFLRGELAHAKGPRENAAIWQIVARLGSNPDELYAPPERSDPLARSFCPTCRTEYRLEAGDCVDCGAALKRLEREAPPGEPLDDTPSDA